MGKGMPCPYFAVHKQACSDVFYLVLGMLEQNGGNGFRLGISISKVCKHIIMSCQRA